MTAEGVPIGAGWVHPDFDRYAGQIMHWLETGTPNPTMLLLPFLENGQLVELDRGVFASAVNATTVRLGRGTCAMKDRSGVGGWAWFFATDHKGYIVATTPPVRFRQSPPPDMAESTRWTS